MMGFFLELLQSERSNDMFCDDIFGESPAGIRKMVSLGVFSCFCFYDFFIFH